MYASAPGGRNRIVLDPRRQQRRPALGEISLELGIEGDVAGIVEEEIELDLIVARRERCAVQRVGSRGDVSRVGDAMGVLPLRRLWREERAQLLAICRRRILPIALDRRLVAAEAFLIGVAVAR